VADLAAAWDPTLRPYLRPGAAAIRNAEDLYRDARLLLRAGRRPRAHPRAGPRNRHSWHRRI
jgi:hypothetical protein